MNAIDVFSVEGLSFLELCMPLRSDLTSFVRKQSRADVQWCEDVVQECMIRACRAWPAFVVHEGAYSPAQAARAWMFRIVHNQSITARGRRVKTSMYDMDHPGYSEAEFEGNIERDHDADVAASVVYEALQSLPANHRQAAVMHFVKGMSIAEIVLETGIRRKTIETHIVRARVRLRPLLAQIARETFGIGLAKPSGRARQDTLEAPEHLEPNADSVERVVAGDYFDALDYVEPAGDQLAAW